MAIPGLPTIPIIPQGIPLPIGFGLPTLAIPIPGSGSAFTVAQPQPANVVTGFNNTAFANPLQVGLGVTYTPTRTGNLLISIIGTGNIGSAFQINLAMVSGTGSAPSQNAPQTGTVFGGAASYDAGFTPFIIKGLLLGKPLGTKIWIDLTYAGNMSSGLGTLTNLMVEIIEY